jgi:hypothetical protein
MKIIKIQGHLRTIEVPITNEEYDLLNKFKSRDTSLSRRDLTEREVHVANLLVIKDVLYRKNQDGNITYKKKTLEE